MPAQLSAVSEISGGTCQITLIGEVGSVTFDVKHRNIPTDAYICLLEVSTIGVALADLGKGINDAGTDEARMAGIRAVQPQIEAIKERFRALPQLLSSVITWQDIKDGDTYVKPSEKFFASLPIEIQAQYASGLIAKKSPSTASSSDNSQTGSTPAVSSDTVPETISLIAPPSTTDALDGNCLPVQTL